MPPKARVSLASMVAEDAAPVATPIRPEPVLAPEPDTDSHPAGVGKNFKRVGLYLHPTVKREIDTIAFTHERKPHDIYLEAVNLVLKKYGRASIVELENK